MKTLKEFTETMENNGFSVSIAKYTDTEIIAHVVDTPYYIDFYRDYETGETTFYEIIVKTTSKNDITGKTLCESYDNEDGIDYDKTFNCLTTRNSTFNL